MIALIRDPFRGDFEIRDKHNNCRGFIWQYEGYWVCRVDDCNARYCDSYDEALILALTLVDQHPAASIAQDEG